MKKGFTLIELLVVIAIIAILAAILFPVFAQAREKARQTACLSNTKQFGTALQLYVDDYDETFPCVTPWCHTWLTNARAHTWVGALEPYVKNVGMFVCPSVPNYMPSDAASKKGNTNPIVSSYYCNGAVFGRLTDNFDDPLSAAGVYQAPKSMADITRLSEIIAIHENTCYYYWVGCLPAQWEGIILNNGSPLAPEIHNGGSNFTFCDGHAKFMKKGAVKAKHYGAKYVEDAEWDVTNWTDQWLTPNL